MEEIQAAEALEDIVLVAVVAYAVNLASEAEAEMLAEYYLH